MRAWRGLPFLALLLGLAHADASKAASAAPPSAPRLELASGRLVLASLPDILSRLEVQPHLTTGLTTTLALRVTATDEGGRKVRGGGRVNIRYELWDEDFLVSSLGADGNVRRETLPSFERLTAWWKSLALPVLPADRLSPDGPWQVKVEVSVIPFSESEQEKTQRWLSQSIAGNSSSSDQASAAAKESPERLGTVLDLLVATSIQRRTLVSYDWTLTFQADRRR